MGDVMTTALLAMLLALAAQAEVSCALLPAGRVWRLYGALQAVLWHRVVLAGCTLYVTGGRERLWVEMAPSEEEAVGLEEGAVGLNPSLGKEGRPMMYQCICSSAYDV